MLTHLPSPPTTLNHEILDLDRQKWYNMGIVGIRTNQMQVNRTVEQKNIGTIELKNSRTLEQMNIRTLLADGLTDLKTPHHPGASTGANHV